MSAELEALIAALRTLNPELKARVAQGIWNDADYHTAFSKLPLKIDELVAVLCSLNAEQKEQLSQAIWTDAEYKATFNKLLISDLQSLQAGTEKQTRQPPHLSIEAPPGNPPAPRTKAPFSTKQALKPHDSVPSPKVAPVSAHSVIDLDPGFDELTRQGRGQAARKAYIKQEGIEKYSAHPKSKQWIRPIPRD